MNTKNTPHKWHLLVYFVSKHVTIIVVTIKLFPLINFLLSQLKYLMRLTYTLLVVSLHKINMLVSFSAPLNTRPGVRSSECQRIFLQRRWQGGQSEFWRSRRRRCERTVTPHSHGASASTPLVDFEWSDVKRCRTELWVRRVASLALLAAEVENFSTFQAPTEASANQIASCKYPIPFMQHQRSMWLVVVTMTVGASAPRFRHALRQALTATPRVNAAWARARSHTCHTPDACAH